MTFDFFKDSENIVLDLHQASAIGAYEYISDNWIYLKNQLNKRNSKKWTPIMYACFFGYNDLVSFFLLQGADVKFSLHSSKSYFEPNLLILAAKSDNDSVIKTLLQHPMLKAQINAKSNSETALFVACSLGHHLSALQLLKNGADPEIISEHNDGKTALLQAIAFDHEQVVKVLLKYKADIAARDLNGNSTYSLNQNDRILDLLDVASMKHSRENVRKSMGLNLVTNGFENLSIVAGPKEMSEKYKTKIKQEQISGLRHQNLPNLESVLNEEGLSKHINNFTQRNCDINIFLTLTEQELKNVYDIKLFGPRRKIFMLIAKLREAYL